MPSRGSSSEVDEDTPSDESDDTTDRTSELERRIAWSRRRLAILQWSARLTVLAVLAGFAYWELRHNRLQAMIFDAATDGVEHRVADGPSDAIRYPKAGPFNRRAGYTRLPDVVERLTDDEYRIARQARVSERYVTLVELGLFPPYRTKQRVGLELRGPHGNRLHRSPYPERHYETFERIPDVVVETLLFIENRALLDGEHPHRNPALEPDRLGRALLDVVVYELFGGDRPDGGSTLATQLEKFRHSAGGRTTGYEDKFRQMLSASIRAYLDDERTLDDQRRIVRAYLNGVPLAAVDGYGEVFGIGDGLQAWFGTSFERANRLLRELSAGETRASLPRNPDRARIYRQVIGLMVAQRRPSHFLRKGRDALALRTDSYLRRLREAGILSEAFARRALASSAGFREPPPVSRPESTRVADEISYNLRTDLLDTTGRDHIYALDRTDLRAETTVDTDVQRAVERRLERLADPAFVERHDLDRWRLLSDDDPSEVVYSFTLYERTPNANKLRVQADTRPGPFDVNRGAKLNLGSTAKLRTTATYLTVVGDLWERLHGLSDEELEDRTYDRRDRIARWVRDYVRDHPDAHLPDVVDAAMERRYSADPEAFFTGGGRHHFENFSHEYDDRWPTVEFALHHSINLVFVRLMRDLVHHHMFRLPDTGRDLLRDPDHPKRREVLRTFARRESRVYLRKFWDRYRDWSPRRSLIRFQDREGGGFDAERFAAAYRAIHPEADRPTFEYVLEEQLDTEIDASYARRLYAEYDPERLDLNDLGYLTRIHPLELWVLRYQRNHPDAEFQQALADSREIRRRAYDWLIESTDIEGQNRRIRTVLEERAFGDIHDHWRRLGYPFDELVPSLATAIGSSSDRPAALAELMGIIVNDGRRKPRVRFNTLHFARGTPFETELRRTPDGAERVMRRAVAERLQTALRGVVDDGTAQRLQTYAAKVDGRSMEVAGKTGTGDNRREVRNEHGVLVRSIPQNRTATFVFSIDDRFFGALTAYVPGRRSGGYEFTSGLAVSVLGLLAPKLRPLWWRESGTDLTAPESPPPKSPSPLVSTQRTAR